MWGCERGPASAGGLASIQRPNLFLHHHGHARGTIGAINDPLRLFATMTANFDRAV